MSFTSKSFKAPFMVTLSIGLVLSAPAAASAANPDPVGDIVKGVVTLLEPITNSSAPVNTAVQAPPPQSPGSTSPGNVTPAPQGADHGSAKGVDAHMGDQAIAGVSDNDATVNDDDSTSADSTLLSLGGNEVLGTHADSNGEKETHFDPLAPITAPICDGSTGAVCLRVLYADAYATDDGKTSHSRARSGIASACLGGTNTDINEACDGPIAVGAASSDGQADRNQATGRTTASSLSDTAGLCVEPDPVTWLCAVGVSALHSEGEADSGNSPSSGSSSGSSYLADLQLGGEDRGRIEDPMDLSIQPECADPSLLCVFLNQGETYLASGIAGHVQDALKATVLPGLLDLFVGVGHTETLVHNDGGNPPPNPPPNPNPKPKPTPDDPDKDSVLPDTGGLWSGLLALGLLGVAGGSLAVAAGRRQRGALV